MEHGASSKKELGFEHGGIVFTDAENSTQHGVSDAYTVALREDLALQRQICEARGGEVVKSRGDGLLMVFPTADAAAQFVLEFRTRKLDQFKGDMGQSRVRSRIVAHYGSFTRGDLDVLGNDVTLCARLIDEVEPPPFRVWLTADLVKSLSRVQLPPSAVRDIKLPKMDRVKVYEVGSSGISIDPKLAQDRVIRNQKIKEEEARRKAARGKEVYRVTLSIVFAALVGAFFYFYRRPDALQLEKVISGGGPEVVITQQRGQQGQKTLGPDNRGSEQLLNPTQESVSPTRNEPMDDPVQVPDDPPVGPPEPLPNWFMRDPEGNYSVSICRESGERANTTCASEGKLDSITVLADQFDDYRQKAVCPIDHTKEQ